MMVAVSTWARATGAALALLLAALLLYASPSRAEPAASAALAQQRGKAVTQVVLGIFSYARWPSEPAPLRLCLIGPTEYADDLIKGTEQNSGRPVLSISEADDLCTVGSLFCLRVNDEQVTFEVNLDSVARSGVRIHPSVLQLSRRRAVQP